MTGIRKVCSVKLLYWYCLLFDVVWAGNIQGVAVNNTLTLGYLVPWDKGWIIGPYIGSAIIVGIQEVYHRQLLPDYEIEWMMVDDYCEPKQGIQVTVDVWNSVEDLDALIGASCSVVCIPESLLAASWNIPVIAWGCSSDGLSNKDIHPTFTRLEGTYVSRAPAFARLTDIFGWDKAGIVSTPEDLYTETSMALMAELQQANKEVVLQIVDNVAQGDQIDSNSLQTLKAVLESIKSKVRVIFIMTYPSDLRLILITALDLGMMNGEYVFITNEFALDTIGTKQTYRPEADEFIFNGMLALGPLEPSGPHVDTFKQNVIDAFQDPRFNHLPHLPPDAAIDQVNVYAGNIHSHDDNKMKSSFKIVDILNVNIYIFGTYLLSVIL